MYVIKGYITRRARKWLNVSLRHSLTVLLIFFHFLSLTTSLGNVAVLTIWRRAGPLSRMSQLTPDIEIIFGRVHMRRQAGPLAKILQAGRPPSQMPVCNTTN